MSEADSARDLPGTSSSHVVQRFNGHFPPIFLGDGKEDFLHWCRRFEVTVEATADFDNVKLAKFLPTCLGGTAFSYWDSLPNDIKKDYKQVKDKMKEVFGKRVYLSTFQSYVNARTRLPGEALQVFAAEISHLVDEAFPTYEANAKNGEKFRRFVAGIEPYLQLRIHEQGVETLDAALTLALQIEQAHQASKVLLPSHSQQWTSSTAGTFAGCSTTSPVLPAVHSATSGDFAKLQRTLESLTERVDQLQLEVNRQRFANRHTSADRHRRSLTPEDSRGRTSERRRYDRHSYTDCDSFYEYSRPSYRDTSGERDCYEPRRQEGYHDQSPRRLQGRGRHITVQDSLDRSSRPDSGRGNRSSDSSPKRPIHRSPSPGHVRFQSTSHVPQRQGNY
ncbi:regulator of microtubule dynamics 1 isoform X1 [Labeo rohita]|uniref:Regulator of microtubule dynamics 1 isoform X1 n=1 Tax=Labeo rohita TaxID=84645 RepID=A0A498NHA1_LABRO|nr:regulator of microtubule dynamics 1 isoform X1 [Labeo rohita]RXN31107.1 regulator of microtubule dynamics 1 isoform X1 [Labeo rohita]